MYCIQILPKLSLLLLIIASSCSAKKSSEVASKTDVEFKVRWKDLSLKIICEEEEWRAQFDPVRSRFTKCLGLKKIIMNDEKEDIDRMSYLKGDTHNPYCKMSKTWDACTHYLEGLTCIEANSDELKRHKGGFMGSSKGEKLDPENMNSMSRLYKAQCEMAKFASSYGPFGSHGPGMDYMEDYDMPTDIDPEGIMPDDDLIQ